MWTGVAHNIRAHLNATLNSDHLFVPVECVYGNDRSIVSITRVVRNEIFDDHSDITYNLLAHDITLLRLNDPCMNYCVKDTPERAIHRYDKHVIAQVCNAYGMPDEHIRLKCELSISTHEQQRVEQFLLGHRLRFKRFITIEPIAKEAYTCNKTYAFNKWQAIVDHVKDACDVQFVQVGLCGSRVLSGVIDATGCMSFKQTAALIGASAVFTSTEGGLMHAASAVETPAVIVYTSYMHPRLTAYPENTNVWLGRNDDHAPCGMKVRCVMCYDVMMQHDYDEIITAIMNAICVH